MLQVLLTEQTRTGQAQYLSRSLRLLTSGCKTSETFSQRYHDTGQLEEGHEHIDMILISHNDTPIGRDPAEGALDCISFPVSIPESVVLSVDVPVVLSVRNQQAYPTPLQASSSRVAIVGLLADHPFWSGHGSSRSSFWDSDLSKSFIKERDLSRRGTVSVASDTDYVT